MSSAQPAFGGRFRELIELGVVEIDTEPLDACIERRLKDFWEHTSCPRCGHNAVQTWSSLDRVWCRDYNFKPVYTYGTPFHEKHLSCGEVLLAFTLSGRSRWRGRHGDQLTLVAACRDSLRVIRG